LAYGHVLDDRGYMDGLVARVVPRWQQLLFQCVRPIAIGGIRRGLRINDEGVARSLSRLDASFVAVGAALSDGRRYLVGGRFTAADLTFAALSAPVLLPPELSHYYGARDAVPEAFGVLVDRLRATPAGAYALRLYAEERGRIGPAARSPPPLPRTPRAAHCVIWPLRHLWDVRCCSSSPPAPPRSQTSRSWLRYWARKALR
jgi:glutathione S-transferase